MVPVAELLERVPLIVRGLARATGKTVAVQIDAGRAELDKAVAERLLPAIVHLVRNAVDHAIEPSAVRVAAGKPAEGVIRVSCHDRSSNQLELSITDDGRGVDREAVARRAGVAVPDTDEALLELIARPGLSTVERATTTSGRGVGVDIVHRIVRDLGGELRLETQPGRGTIFTVRVPLSITIIDAFSFMAAGEVFVIPVAAVDEVIEVDPARTTRGPQRTGATTEVKLIERRGAAIPLVDLARIFDLPHAGSSVPQGLSPKAIVVRRAGSPYAFMVDRMLGQQEVVVRPVIDPLIRVPGVTGSTDLGDGKPVLVLDLAALTGRLIDEWSPVRGAA
jgi:two-component system chemotaxis sensor kinase CheA